AELRPGPDDQRFESQGRAEVDLLEGAPVLADDLASSLRSRQPLGGAVLREHGEPVGVDDGMLGADGDDDEVAVPGGELLERGEQLVAFGAARGAANALLRLPRGQ